ncbi:MAG TPA: hypothetical protein EYP17_01660 [Candidatus Latescibacteria bacterium]|nr:hypothetical protein [Candidatus Latescibacterota bacterium]
MKKFLEIVDRDEEVRELFIRLFEENRDPERLFDLGRLQELGQARPDLVERATRYYSQFRRYSM